MQTFEDGGQGEVPFQSYEQFMTSESERIAREYQNRKKYMLDRAYFFNVVFPLVFASVRTSILEYQAQVEDLEAV